jgi:hypothetical protein
MDGKRQTTAEATDASTGNDQGEAFIAGATSTAARPEEIQQVDDSAASFLKRAGAAAPVTS